MEGRVIDYRYGTGKFRGMLGSLILELKDGSKLEFLEFTIEERNFQGLDNFFIRGFRRSDARENPSYLALRWVNHPLFPRGSIVKFKIERKSRNEVL